MLSDRLYRFVGIIVPIYAYFGICKYTYNPKLRLFTPVEESKRNTAFIILNTTLTFTWLVFHVFQIGRFYYEHNLNNLVFMVACIIAIFLAILCSLFTVWWAKDFYFTINSALVFLRNMNGKSLMYSQSNFVDFQNN